jgi:hypothetical protein
MPTTLVYAEELSVEAILQGVRDARTVVKIIGPQAPMIETELTGERRGDTVFAMESTLRATVTAGDGTTLQVIKNGAVVDTVPVVGDPFVHEFETEAPATGEDRYRHALFDATNRPLTLTSYVWLQREQPTPTPTVPPSPTATATRDVTTECAGDCNGDTHVGIGELVTGVNISLGIAELSACAALDRNGNGTIEIHELVTAVDAALNTCV